MKLSVYNPTGIRATIRGNGRFAGIVVRSLFATRGHQFFDVASQEHANWLIRHINAVCPAAQVTVIGDDSETVTVVDAAIVAPAAIELTELIHDVAPVVQEEIAPVVQEEIAPEPTEKAQKPVSKKKQTVNEIKE